MYAYIWLTLSFLEVQVIKEVSYREAVLFSAGSYLELWSSGGPGNL